MRVGAQETTMKDLRVHFKAEANEAPWLKDASVSAVNGTKSACLTLQVCDDVRQLPVKVTVNRIGGANVELEIEDKHNALERAAVTPEMIFDIMSTVFRDPAVMHAVQGRGGLLSTGSEDVPTDGKVSLPTPKPQSHMSGETNGRTVMDGQPEENLEEVGENTKQD